MITQRDLDLWSEKQESTQRSGQEASARSLELRKRSNDLQKKTYTKWINSFLNEHGLHVEDLYTDLKDGKLLIRLLEVISGEKIEDLTGRSSRAGAKFYVLARIGKAFQFLHQKNIKLEGIQPSDIQEGHIEHTLALIWAIILGFQFYQHAIPSIKTLAEEPKPQFANVHKNSIAVAAVPSAKKGLVGTGVTSDAEEAEEELEEQNVRGAMKALLHWCQKNTAGYHGVEVNNFTTSWIDGLAFNALIHKHRPDLIDFESLWGKSPFDILDNAFDVAEEHFNIPRLLDAEDVNPSPDKRSIVVYLSMYFLHLKEETSSASPTDKQDKFVEKTVSQTARFGGPKESELVVGNPNLPNVQQRSPPTAGAAAASTGPPPIRSGEQPPPYQPPPYPASQQRYPQYRPYPQQPYPQRPYPQQPYPQKPYPQQPYGSGYYQKKGYHQQYGYYARPPYQQQRPVYPQQPYYPPLPPMRQMQQMSVQVDTGSGVVTLGSQQSAGGGGMMQSMASTVILN